MTIVGSGGVTITSFKFKKTFERDFKKLSPDLQAKFKSQVIKLMKENKNGTLGFEKLKGYKRPDIFTIHIEGNYKASFEIVGAEALFRRIGNHDRIDRSP